MTNEEFEQMILDHKFMKSRDDLWGIFQWDFKKDVLVDLNVRFIQYKAQMKAFPKEQMIIQTILDHQNVITPMQKNWKKIDIFKPLASYKGKMIYIGLNDQFSYDKTVQKLGS